MAAGKTSNVYLTGKLRWVRAVTPNQWGDYQATIYPNAESLEICRELAAKGLKNTIKKDEDGYYVTYKRPTQKIYNGKAFSFAPVVLLDGTKPLEGGGFAPLDGTNVGDGSDGVMKIQVYPHRTPSGGTSYAGRLESIRIDKLVPFEKEESFTEEELRATKGLADQPAESLW